MTPKQIKIELKKYGLTDADIKDMGDAELQAKLDDLKLEFGSSDEDVIDGDDLTTDINDLESVAEQGIDGFAPQTISIQVKCTLTCVIKDPCRVGGEWYREGDSVRMPAGDKIDVGFKTREYLSKQRVLK